MPEAIFKCVDDKNNLESCKFCASTDFMNKEISVKVIICANCGKLHRVSPQMQSIGEILRKTVGGENAE